MKAKDLERTCGGELDVNADGGWPPELVPGRGPLLYPRAFQRRARANRDRHGVKILSFEFGEMCVGPTCGNYLKMILLILVYMFLVP